MLAASLAGASAPAWAEEDFAALGRQYFPAGYAQSRAAFRQACAQLPGAVCAAYPVRYPDLADADLTIDTAYADFHQPRLLILQSGIHGVEAYAGAAVQRMVFARHLARLRASGFDVLMIHALNPYGFKYGRRVDGNNVDLNRNFAPPAQAGFYRRVNQAYRDAPGLTLRTGPVASVALDSARIAAATLWAAAWHGFSVGFIGNASHAGQYETPRDFDYGGQAPAQQTAFWQDVVRPLMQAHAGDIYVLDMHTGLGAANVLTLYSGNAWPAAREARLRQLVADTGDGGIRMQSPRESPYQDSGDMIDFAPALLADGRVTAITVEWGTIGEDVVAQLRSNARMVLENQAHFYGCVDDAVCAAVRANFLAMFNPDSDAFRAGVLREADALLTQLEAAPPGAFSGLR